MTTEITTTKTFQDRMYEKIRDQIGDLMTDEDLKKLIDVAMHKAFFEERTIQEGYYTTRKLPPYFVELIQEHMKKSVTDIAEKWLTEHHEEVRKCIDEVIGKGFLKVITDYFDNKIYGALYSFGEELKTRGVLK